MKHSQKKNPRPLPEWLSVRLDIPADVLEGGMRLDLRGRRTLTVEGCRGILAYTPEEITLAMLGTTLHIRGERLVPTTYLAGAVGVEGCIHSLAFEDPAPAGAGREGRCSL